MHINQAGGRRIPSLRGSSVNIGAVQRRLKHRKLYWYAAPALYGHVLNTSCIVARLVWIPFGDHP